MDMEAIKIEQNARPLDDQTIVRRILSGEKALFELLLRRYNQTLYRIIRSYLKDTDEVKDAMQNAYLKAFDKLSQFRGDSSFATWLIRIGINEALQQLNASKNVKMIYLDSSSTNEINLHQIPDKQMNPERAIIRQESKQLLEQAIDKLPEKYRIVYVMREIEGLESKQLEDTLGLTEANIKVRLHRAKKLLQESLYELSVNREVFEFGNRHCDSVVDFVMRRI